MLRRLLIALLVGVTMTATLAVAPVDSNAIGVVYNGTAFRKWALGRALGPIAATDYGKIKLTGFTLTHTSAKGYTTWKARTTITEGSKGGPSPLVRTEAAHAIIGAMGAFGITVHLDDWWNPFSWDWSDILGKIYKNFVLPCLSGATEAFLPTVTGTVAINLLFDGAKLYVGPYGYAALIVGGCVWGVIH